MAEMYAIGSKHFLVMVMNKLLAQLILISAGDLSAVIQNVSFAHGML